LQGSNGLGDFSLDNDRSPEPERDLGREKIALTSENHSVSKVIILN
jgi:hypothetical protein